VRIRRAGRTLAGIAASLVVLAGMGWATAHPIWTSAASTPAVSKTAAKKGVDAWAFTGVKTALARSGATWYLDWSTSPEGITAPAGVHFVAMIWGAGSMSATDLSEAKHYGPYLLTFNEPDLSSQAHMTVAQALALWPKLEATGLQLASPAVATGAATPGGWLDRFIRGAANRHYRVNFIALHWYGSDFKTSDAVAQLRSYLVAVHHRYPTKPIWLTEYSLINFGNDPQYPSGAQQAAFVSASISMLDGLPYLARFAWFALPTAGAQSTGLYGPGAVPTAAGKAFAKVR
jgi:hypothetical protein